MNLDVFPHPGTEEGIVVVEAVDGARSAASTTNRLPIIVSPSSASSGPEMTMATEADAR